MIIVKIRCGLGNQLFQYAFARALALKCQAPLYLDVGQFLPHFTRDDRPYALDRFNIQFDGMASEADISRLSGLSPSGSLFWMKLKRKLGGVPSYLRCNNTDFYYDMGRLDKTKDLYVEGFWQDYRYAQSIDSELRQDLQFKEPLTGLNLEVAQHIQACNAVSVHIRRGDYVLLKKYNLLQEEYYKQALATVHAKVANPEFFVFSDDLAWVKQNMRYLGKANFIGHNTEAEAYQDLRLMSLCNTQIIANSTLSWWGAWLNPHPEKLILCPKSWVSSEGLKKRKVLPPEWHAL